MVRRPWELVWWVLAILIATSIGGRLVLDAECRAGIAEVHRSLEGLSAASAPAPRLRRGDPLPGNAWEDYAELRRLTSSSPPANRIRTAEDLREWLRPGVEALLRAARRRESILPPVPERQRGDLVRHRMPLVLDLEMGAALQHNNVTRALDLAFASAAYHLETIRAEETCSASYPSWVLDLFLEILQSGAAEDSELLTLADALASLEDALPDPVTINRIRARDHVRSLDVTGMPAGEWKEEALPFPLGGRYLWSDPLRTLTSLRHHQRVLAAMESCRDLPLPDQVGRGRLEIRRDSRSWFGWAKNWLHPGNAPRQVGWARTEVRALRQAALHLAGRDDRLEGPVGGPFDVLDEHGLLSIRCSCHEAVVVRLHRS